MLNSRFSIPILYLIFGLLWIYYSDYALFLFTNNHDTIDYLQTIKGWFFVSSTAILLYVYVRKGEMSRKKANENTDELLFFKCLIEHNAGAIICLDKKGNIVFYNKQGANELYKITGNKIERLTPFLQIIDNETDRYSFKTYIDTAIKGDKSVFDYQVNINDQKYIYTIDVSPILCTVNTNIYNTCIHLTDTTDVKSFNLKTENTIRDLLEENNKLKIKNKELTSLTVSQKIVKAQDPKTKVLSELIISTWIAKLPDLSLSFIDKNIEKIYGYLPIEFSNNPNLWIDQIHSNDVDKVTNAIRSIRKGITISIHYRIVDHLGGLRYVLNTFQLSENSQDRVEGAIFETTML